MTEPTEEIIVAEKKVKEKKPRTEAQLAILSAARAKALEVRKANAELRNQEKEIVKAEKTKALEERKKKVADYGKPKDPEPEPEVEYHNPPVVKKKKKKKVVVVEESESSSSEEEEVVVVKKKKKKVKEVVVQEDRPPQFTKEQLHKRAIAQRNYNKVYSQMNGTLC
mgnify:CR=1 FL=1|tara:strand:+ start:703 stop:1203 length:501 start_codon:yes stop_codon:yes gene_type:complete